MNGQVKIESMFAFVVVDDDGTEGIPAIAMGDMAMPLVGADMERVDQLRPAVEQIARKLDKPVTLVHFTNRTELEVIQ